MKIELKKKEGKMENPWSEGLGELERQEPTIEQLRKAVDEIYRNGDKVLMELLGDYLKWVQEHGEG